MSTMRAAVVTEPCVRGASTTGSLIVARYPGQGDRLPNCRVETTNAPANRPGHSLHLVDPRRFELLTSSMRTRRATNCAKGPSA